MAIGARKLKSFTLQQGKKGGSYYVTETGKKVYTKEAPKGGDAGGAPRAPKAEAKPRAPAGKAAAAPKGKVEFHKLETKPVAKVQGDDGKMRPGGGAGAQLHPDVVARLKSLGVNKLPAAHIAEVHASPHLHDDAKAHKGALLKWKDDKGKTQSAYSEQHDIAQAKKKWARVEANRPKVEAAITDLKAKAKDSPAHAAALLMEQTALRPGSEKSVKGEGHYGATTLEGRHLKFEGGKAHVEFVGKQGKLNKATIEDPALVSALKKHAEGKGPNDRIFKGATTEQIRAAVPPGVKLKDLRTIGATKHAEAEFEKHGKPMLTGDKKADARAIASILKGVSESVSSKLNNTPAMARRSYIHPNVVTAWAEKHGVPKELIKWP